MLRAVAAALVVLMLMPAAGMAQGRGDVIDITNDKGGNVLEMVQRRSQLENSGKRVRIRGYCRSACTMLITMRNACLGPGAKIGFHAPRLPGTTIIPPYVDQIMGNTYRGGIRDQWFGGWNRSIDMKVITAREYVRLDPQTPICDELRRRNRR